MLFTSPVVSAQIQNEKVFSVVPLAQRQRLIERFNLYVDHLIKTDQPSLERLYDEQTLCSLCKGNCVEDCAPPMTVEVPKGFRSVILGFRPIKVSPYSPNGIWDYAIDVEQTERLSWEGKPPHSIKNKVRVFAVYQRGDWYFSPISIAGMVYL